MTIFSGANRETKSTSRRSMLAQLGFLASWAGACGFRRRAPEDKGIMKSGLELTLACIDNYDRTRPILDGSVKLEGINLKTMAIGPTELFRRVAQRAEFDIAEMSTSTYMALKSQADDRFVGIPVFPSRNFRHGYIFVNRRSGISHPKDLVGKRVGLPEYQTTAALWQRSFLKDDYGVLAHQIEWFEGGLDKPNEPERFHINLPSNIHLRRIGEGETLSRLLDEGKLDALIGPGQPECFGRSPHVVRLFPDYRRVEKDYYKRTKFFPIMHMVVVRSQIYRANPWVVQSVFKGFESAKALGFQRLWDTGVLACAVPWLMSDLQEIRELFGSNYWPYGIAQNRAALERMTQASVEQGLSSRKLEVRELFAPEISET